jgi:protease YdgD
MTAWRWLAAMFLCFAVAVGSVQAQDSALQPLDSWSRGHGWEGVGLLSLDGRATCTGVLIQPDLVLTAAHCLLNAQTGQRIDPRRIEFRAGLRNGQAVARRWGRVGVVHPDFAASSKASGDQVRNDVALIQLDSPIPATHATPFAALGGLRTGDRVSAVSYGVGRNDAPSRQQSCQVLQVQRGLVAMSCEVVAGSSGAPVFEIRNGRPVVVALVSSAGTVDGRQIAYGMDIAAPLARVMRDFRATGSGAKRIGVGRTRSAGGARFLKP